MTRILSSLFRMPYPPLLTPALTPSQPAHVSGRLGQQPLAEPGHELEIGAPHAEHPFHRTVPVVPAPAARRRRTRCHDLQPSPSRWWPDARRSARNHSGNRPASRRSTSATSWVRVGSTAIRRRAPLRNSSTHSWASRTVAAHRPFSRAKRTRATRPRASCTYCWPMRELVISPRPHRTQKSGFRSQYQEPSARSTWRLPRARMRSLIADRTGLEQAAPVEEEDAVLDDVQEEWAVESRLGRRLDDKVPLHRRKGPRRTEPLPCLEQRPPPVRQAARKSFGHHHQIDVRRRPRLSSRDRSEQDEREQTVVPTRCSFRHPPRRASAERNGSCREAGTLATLALGMFTPSTPDKPLGAPVVGAVRGQVIRARDSFTRIRPTTKPPTCAQNATPPTSPPNTASPLNELEGKPVDEHQPRGQRHRSHQEAEPHQRETPARAGDRTR